MANNILVIVANYVNIKVLLNSQLKTTTAS